MNKLSVVIITFNEEKNILNCLNSVKDIADEVVVVDSGSTDRTVQLCEEQGCRVFHRDFDHYPMQKQFGVDQAKNDWVFSIDADETISEKLKSEIQSICQEKKLSDHSNEQLKSGYIIHFRLFYLGHQMKRSGNAKTIRLFDRRMGGFVQIPVHEYIKVRGQVGSLKGEIIHHSYRDITHHIQKINSYTSYAAQEYRTEKKSFSKFRVFLKLPVTFFIHYIIRGGFLDGYPGFMWAFFAAFYTSIKIAKTIEMADQA